MLYVAEQLLFPWLPIAFLVGFGVAWFSCGPAKSEL